MNLSPLALLASLGAAASILGCIAGGPASRTAKAPATASAGATASAHATTPADTPIGRFADSLFRARYAADAPGAAVAIFRAGAVTHLGTYGLADLGAGDPVSANSNFYLASASKPFTALAIALLVREGTLRYEDRLVDLVPELRHADSTITVRHLLLHTAGLADFYGFIDWPRFRSLDNRGVLDTTRNHAASSFTPGSRYEYSNTGYVLLSIIAERRAGRSLGTLLSERVFRPLGMRAIVYDDSTRAVPGRAKAYSPNAGRFLLADLDALELPDGRTLRFTFLQTGQGGVFASIRDMATWGMAMLDTTLLRQNEKAELFRVQLPTPQQQGIPAVRGVAHGWFVSERHGRTVLWHDGSRGGSKSIVALVPAEGFGVVILSNRGDTDPIELATLLLDRGLPPGR